MVKEIIARSSMDNNILKLEPTEKKQKFQWLVGKVLIISNDGKLLMGKRTEGVDFGKYEMPGGKMEVGELFTEGLKREIKEETGLEVELKLPDTENISTIHPYLIVLDPRKRMAVFIEGKVVGDKLGGEGELTDLKFYSVDEIRKLLNQGLIRNFVKPAVEKFIGER